MLRIGNYSGFYGDRLAAMREMLEGGELDVLTGDYLAELTMLILGRDRRADPALGYARTFVAQLHDCLRLALDRGVRIVTNAGGVNPAGLVAAIRQLGLTPRIALVRGDELGPGRHAYLGAYGIAQALKAGADVVVTGRVTDASLVVGPAIAHYGWARDDFDALAGATVAGHVLECGTQATGGNYAFFGEIADLTHPGFPLAEIHPDGSSVITKHAGTGGAVTVGTVTAQLVYEVSGARYFGPDVTTRLDSIALRQDGDDRVRISGVRGEAPPPELKVAATSIAGFRNSMTVVLTGLDIEEKAALFRRQLVSSGGTDLTWELARVDQSDPPTQHRASALLTVTARGTDEKRVGRAFSGAAVELALASFPGFFATTPPGRARPYGVMKTDFVPQNAVRHEVLHDDGTVEPIAPPVVTQDMDAPLEDQPTIDRYDVTACPGTGVDLGPTWRVPLGTVAGARSGDKGGDANVGVWVRTDDAYRWLSGLLTVPVVHDLLPETEGLPVRITRLPNIRAVNIVIEGLLGEGVAANARFDPQAKALGEWLRARDVDVPVSLLGGPAPAVREIGSRGEA